MQISTEPVWLLSLIVCCALVKSPNTNVRCRIVLHSTFLPSQKKIKHKHNIRCAKQIQKKIIQAEEDEVHDTKVEGFVVRDLDSLGCAFIAL